MKRTVIKAHCPHCGAVRVPPEAITLISGASDTAAPSRYVFCCPTCGGEVARSASQTEWQLLLTHGARVRTPSPETRPAFAEAPPFGFDDLIDFHELLKTDGWFDQLLKVSSAGSDVHRD